MDHEIAYRLYTELTEEPGRCAICWDNRDILIFCQECSQNFYEAEKSGAVKDEYASIVAWIYQRKAELLKEFYEYRQGIVE